VLRPVSMIGNDTEIDTLTEKIIGCGIEVHRLLGPGLLESVYRDCMLIELRQHQLRVDSEPHISFDYKGERLGGVLKLDLLVSNTVVVELKSVDRLLPVHSAQVITYLKIAGYPAGLLMNFNSIVLRDGIKRLDHPDRYRRRVSNQNERTDSS
jgi:GxxExxY protein